MADSHDAVLISRPMRRAAIADLARWLCKLLLLLLLALRALSYIAKHKFSGFAQLTAMTACERAVESLMSNPSPRYMRGTMKAPPPMPALLASAATCAAGGRQAGCGGAR